MDALRQIFAQFDVVFDVAPLEKGASAIEKLTNKLKQAGNVLAGTAIIAGVAAFAKSTMEMAREVEFGASRLGMQTDEYQKLNQVAKLYGMTTEQMQIAMRMLERGLSDTGGTMGTFGGRTKAAKEAMHNLGLNSAEFKGQTLEKILPVLADAFQKVKDPVEQTAIALRLFGHRGLAFLPMMKQGGEELRKQMAEMQPIFEESTIKTADKAAVSANRLHNAWERLIRNQFGRAAMNAFTSVANVLSKVLVFMQDMIKASDVGAVSLGVLASVAVVAGLKMAIAFAPFLATILAIAAGLTAVVLIIDDFVGFMEGKRSVTGRLIDKIFGKGSAEEFRKWVDDVVKDFKEIWAIILSAGKNQLLEDLKMMRDVLHEIVDMFRYMQHVVHVFRGEKPEPGSKAESVLNFFGKLDKIVGTPHNPVGFDDSGKQIGTPTLMTNAPIATISPVPFIGPPTAPMIGPPQAPPPGGITPMVVQVDARGNLTQDEIVTAVRDGVNSINHKALRDANAAFVGAP